MHQRVPTSRRPNRILLRCQNLRLGRYTIPVNDGSKVSIVCNKEILNIKIRMTKHKPVCITWLMDPVDKDYQELG